MGLDRLIPLPRKGRKIHPRKTAGGPQPGGDADAGAGKVAAVDGDSVAAGGSGPSSVAVAEGDEKLKRVRIGGFCARLCPLPCCCRFILVALRLLPRCHCRCLYRRPCRQQMSVDVCRCLSVAVRRSCCSPIVRGEGEGEGEGEVQRRIRSSYESAPKLHSKTHSSHIHAPLALFFFGGCCFPFPSRGCAAPSPSCFQVGGLLQSMRVKKQNTRTFRYSTQVCTKFELHIRGC